MGTQEVRIKKSEDVIGFLREFNFGDSNEDARTVVNRFLEYMKVRGNEKLLMNEPSFPDLLADELEKAGFAEPGTLSHETWSSEHEQALYAVLESLKINENTPSY